MDCRASLAMTRKWKPPTSRLALNRRRSRRKADRPPRLMARKPSSADALRPALEGLNKQLAEGRGLRHALFFVSPGLTRG